MILQQGISAKTNDTTTEYDKVSCRACGSALMVVKICRHCREPIVWNCPQCLATYGSTHVHCLKQRRSKEEEGSNINPGIKIS